MKLSNRLGKVAKALADRLPLDQFHIIEAVPISRAERRKPGLYRDGPEGSLVGRLVYDPAKGEPVVPEGKLAPFGLVIVCGPEHIEPPDDVA
ncbi:hypothetical protein VT84_12260 [Gemmata sp. SH-PL17]|uniref:hypothetical protein n=1 Tax=Gemmata sp. SH-PL17 TaxID=1630693 RepID=UPI00078B36C3|nr:hypothetical protein [Gemmata sp. SH-PL17]AMV25163.1 hypothetical protein VT84_12260 [Gemmata sp. SH-PL17]